MTDFNWLVGSLITMIGFGAIISSFSFVEKTYKIKTDSQFVIYFIGLAIGMTFLFSLDETSLSSVSLENVHFLLLVLLVGVFIGGWVTAIFTEAVDEAGSMKEIEAAVPMAIYGSSSLVTLVFSYICYNLSPDNFKAVDFNLEKVFAILVVIFGVYKLGSTKKKEGSNLNFKKSLLRWNWFSKSLIYTFTLGLSMVGFSFILTKYGISVSTQFTFYLIGMGFGVPVFSKKEVFTSLKKDKKTVKICLIILFGLGAIFGGWINLVYANAVGNVMGIKEIGAAVSIAIVGASSIVTVLICFFGYKLFPNNFNVSELNLKNIVSMVIVIFGIYLLGS